MRCIQVLVAALLLLLLALQLQQSHVMLQRAALLLLLLQPRMEPWGLSGQAHALLLQSALTLLLQQLLLLRLLRQPVLAARPAERRLCRHPKPRRQLLPCTVLHRRRRHSCRRYRNDSRKNMPRPIKIAWA